MSGPAGAVPFTGYAMRALRLSIEFTQAFAAHTPKLELVTPEGTSTDGGKRGTLFLKMTTANGTLVIGTAHAADEVATFVTYDEAAAQLPGRSLPVDRATYEKTVEAVTRFYRLHKIRIGSEPEAAPPAPVEEPRKSMLVVYVGIALAVAVVVGVGAFLALR